MSSSEREEPRSRALGRVTAVGAGIARGSGILLLIAVVLVSVVFVIVSVGFRLGERRDWVGWMLAAVCKFKRLAKVTREGSVTGESGTVAIVALPFPLVEGTG